jgi:hypothetical protein
MRTQRTREQIRTEALRIGRHPLYRILRRPLGGLRGAGEAVKAVKAFEAQMLGLKTTTPEAKLECAVEVPEHPQPPVYWRERW